MRYLLVLAKLDADKKRIIGAMATAAKLDLAVSEKAEAALTWLDGHEPRVVVFDTAMVQTEKLCQKIRSKKKLASVPLIALVSDTTDAFVERLYGHGADDVIRVDDSASLMARLRSLPEAHATSGGRGVAVIADKEHARCDVFGRVLMNAGYDVKFALDDVALKYYTQQSKPKVVVASTELAVPRPVIEEARKRGCDAVWVITTPRRELVKQVEAVDGLEGVMVVANSTAPDNVLFMSNELMRKGEPPARAAERVLFGTVVLFREAGADADDMGFSYNVSTGGLYVRTLAPPEADRVWLELRPPRGKQRVRLQARVAWRRFYDPASPAAVPPGFGVELEDGLGDGLQEWRSLVDKFIQSTRMGRKAVAKLLADMLSPSQASVQELNEDVAAIRLVRDSLADGAGEAEVLEVKAVADAQVAGVTPPAKPAIPPPLPAAAIAARKPGADEPEELSAALVSVREDASDEAAEPVKVAEPVKAAEPTEAAEPAEATEPPEAPPKPPAPSELDVTPAPPPLPEPKRTEPRSRAKLVVGALGLLLLAAGGAAYALGWFAPSPATGPAAQVSAQAFPTSSAALAKPAAPELSAAPAAPEPSAAPAAPEPSSAPAEASDAAAPASDAAAAASDAASLPAVDDSEGGDGSELPWSEGYLVVRSSEAADVYATGFKIGPTNKKNKSKCGLRFVRLGKGDPPSWLTKGKTVDVKCQATTSIDLSPE